MDRVDDSGLTERRPPAGAGLPMQMVFQLLVLGFTAYVWWLARRDLAQRASQVGAPAIKEWERLQETVQALIGEIERRATAAEQRVAAAEQRIAEAEARLIAAGEQGALPAWTVPPAPEAPAPDVMVYPTAEQAAHEERYAPVYALADAGVTDAAEIARRTGLGYGEIVLVLGLYARRPSR